jgi:folylpolyglutamate synthase/dihydropteroate synthase
MNGKIMKTKNNQIRSSRFKAKRLMQSIIMDGAHTPHGQRMLYRLNIAMIKGRVSLASMGMTKRNRDGV